MKKSILYIHGFASGPGQKAKDLQKAFPDHDIVSPQLSGQINLDMFNLKTYLFDKSFDFDAIVGTSLGGFYALALRTEAIINIPTYVINPALSPCRCSRAARCETCTQWVMISCLSWPLIGSPHSM